MINQQTAILLIIMMLISPITSAFDHCSGMVMPVQLSESLNFNTNGLVQHKPLLEKQGMHHYNESKPNQSDMDCPAGYSCSGYAITQPPASAIKTFVSLNYSSFEHFSPNSTDLSPVFRPPITLL